MCLIFIVSYLLVSAGLGCSTREHSKDWESLHVDPEGGKLPVG